MLHQTRRIVTTNGHDGKSRILSDGPTPHVVETGPDRGLINLWITGADGPRIDGDADGADRPVQLEPPPGGGVFRFFQIGPAVDTTGRPAEEIDRAAAAAFEAMGAGHLRVDTTRHPSMHKSHTLDYIVVLKGRVRLVLDHGEVDLEPLDVVIQRGTNHAWTNLTNEPVLMLGVLLDTTAPGAPV
ncbi:cupin domain-containing protein [Azospirillum endophyticum]